MTFIEIAENKKRYLDLLLLADEQEDMLDRYLERGTMYVLDDCGVKCVCVVTDEGDGLLDERGGDGDVADGEGGRQRTRHAAVEQQRRLVV